jgi:ABC-type transport system involved in multi-copper enzyme maturation permease subunit
VNAALVAHNTFREARRDRVLVGAIVAGVALLAVTQVLSPLALGESSRLTVDLGLSGMSFLGLMLVLMVGTSLVAKEIEKKTIYNLLSRPLSRHEYLIGKWAGLSATLWTLCGALGLALVTVMTLRGHGGHAPAIAEATYLAALELSVVTAIAVLFSALSTPVLSALYTLALYVVGQWSYDLRAFAKHFPPALAATCDAAANVVPNLPLFNMRSLAAVGQVTTPGHLGIATAYALVYCGCALALATAAFQTRDFK